jgi:hypothetical protein
MREVSVPRYFSLPEARALLEEIRPLVERMLQIREAILARQPEAWPVVQKAVGNGGGKTASQLVQEFEKLDQTVRHIQDLGVLIKDVNTGLLDFPSLRDGRVVYLCWRYNEPDVAYWHEIDAGFVGRQRL